MHLLLVIGRLSQQINGLLLQQQQQKQQQQQDTELLQNTEQQRQLGQWQQEELQQQHWQQQHWDQGTEYIMPAKSRISSVFSRRLQQQAPAMCGKLGTYIPNHFTNLDGSMFGLALSPNTDGSIIGVGAPLNAIDAAIPGRAMLLTSWSSQTCEYAPRPVWQPPGGYRYFGAQVALSEDGTTFAVMDGVEGIQTPSLAGNRPVVHVYRRFTNGTYVYLQKLNTAPRKAMAAAMSVSITADAQTILVSFSIGEGFPDKVGSAQVRPQPARAEGPQSLRTVAHVVDLQCGI
jgi:flagellar motor protein MotB